VVAPGKPSPSRTAKSPPTDTVADLLIDEYETRFGDLSDRCRAHIHNVVYVDRGERIYADSDFALGSDNRDVFGEHFYDGASYIWLEKSLTPMSYNALLAHELIHALLACESDPQRTGIGDGDSDHNEPDFWCTTGHGCNWDGKDDTDSLEYAVAEMVRYYHSSDAI
jgi:hypothetical protein